MRGATLVRLRPYRTFQISIHAPLAGCDLPPAWRFQSRHDISIHAPLAGCDTLVRAARRGAGNFNPRTPCGVRRRGWEASMADGQFQSTHPLRGATAGRNGVLPLEQFQSTHPLRGATQNKHQQFAVQEISIHAPLTGCDYSSHHSRQDHRNFNPRTPCGVRRGSAMTYTERAKFQSTHPLRGATKAPDDRPAGGM